MIVYWDTSALIKQYIQEIGTADVAALVQQATASATAQICYVEIAATLAKLVRMSSMTDKVRQMIWTNFGSDWPTLIHIQTNHTLLVQGATFASMYHLRGYDAIHLASAYLWQNMLGETVTFATYDQQLWNAAQAVGMDPFPQNV